MSNSPNLLDSGKRLSFYQLFEQEKLRVEIPLIQRDYAQGRAEVIEVRTGFLDALHDYLAAEAQSRDLDFVYGRVLAAGKERACFIPLDGQQRLTTLFLLHWYLAQLDDQAEAFQAVLSSEHRVYFTYETRISSREFCQALVRYKIDLKGLKSEQCLSDVIKDQGWFYLSWQHDPTIQSMLTMLDAIHAKFQKSEGYFAKLTDPVAPAITFLFLNLDEFKLTDDLYIKMNSRGKMLTEFENFKAQLVKKMQTFPASEPWQNYSLSFFPTPISGAEYFSHKIDTDWANLFWSCWKKESAFDGYLMTFIQLSLANHSLLQQTSFNQELYRTLFGQGSQCNALSFMEHERLNSISQEWTIDLMSRLDLLLVQQGATTGDFATYLDPNPYYDEKSVFKKVGENKSNLTEKLRFHALYTALLQGKRHQELLEWMRVIFNLTENSVIEDGETYHRALHSINELATKDDILSLLTQGVTVAGFSGSQVFEERVKAHLILKDGAWKDAILKLEQHVFFKGQIGFALRFSGVVDYFEQHKNLAWSITEDAEYLKEFERYAAAAAAVFAAIAKDSAALNYAWERAVLSKGDYRTTASANRYNLLSTRTTKNNVDRDHSWHRLLRLALKGTHDLQKWLDRQDCVKEVFDDENFDAENLEKSLEKIAFNVLSEPSTSWQHLLIRTPQLFELCRQGFMTGEDSEVALLHESQRNHYRSEPYTKFLEIELQHRKIDIQPFEKIGYEPVRSTEEWPYLLLSDYILQEQHFSLEVFYYEKKYHFFFGPVEGVSYPPSLTSCLGDLGYELYVESESYDPSYDLEYEGDYFLTCDDYEQAMDKIKKLCLKLQDIE